MATISLQSLAGRGFPVFDRPSKSGTISRCLFHANASVCWTHIGSPVFGHWSWFVVSSATHGHASSRLCGAQKNRLQGMWSRALSLVRPHDQACARSVQRQHAGLSGVRGPSGAVSLLRQGEAGATRLPCRQSVLYKTVCLVRRSALSDQHDQRCGRRTQSGLAHGQGVGQAVHACAIGQGSTAGSARRRPRAFAWP